MRVASPQIASLRSTAMILSSASPASTMRNPPTTRADRITSDFAIGRSLTTQMSSGSPSPRVEPGESAATRAAAVGARDETVQRRRRRRGSLRPIDAQVAGALVDLVLHQVERRDLDVRAHDARRILADLEPVPRVRAPLRVRDLRHRHTSSCRLVETGGLLEHREGGDRLGDSLQLRAAAARAARSADRARACTAGVIRMSTSCSRVSACTRAATFTTLPDHGELHQLGTADQARDARAAVQADADAQRRAAPRAASSALYAASSARIASAARTRVVGLPGIRLERAEQREDAVADQCRDVAVVRGDRRAPCARSSRSGCAPAPTGRRSRRAA